MLLDARSYFQYHAKCKDIQLTHLIFADDILLFCKADSCSPQLMKDILTEFSETSGLKMNPAKSHMFFGGTSTQMKQSILQQLTFVEEKLPVRYDGLPLISTRLSYADCKPVRHSLHASINSWASKFLSYAGGRVQLVNSVLFQLQTYWCDALLLPSITVLN